MRPKRDLLIAVAYISFALHFYSVAICKWLGAVLSAALDRLTGIKTAVPLTWASLVKPTVFLDYTRFYQYPGFQTDVHEWPTADGYLLKAFRVGRRRGKPVVLAHGLLDCSLSWCLKQDKKTELPYLLAKEGYDVWIVNYRAVKHTSGHQTLDVEDPKFWDFSFDELAKYDVPAIIEYVLEQSGKQRLSWVGHSQGFTSLMCSLAQEPQSANKIERVCGLGPVLSVSHSQLKIFPLLIEYKVLDLLEWLGFLSILRLPDLLNRGTGILIELTTVYKDIFFWVVNMICGVPAQCKLEEEMFGTVIAQEPGGCSIRNIKQWMQFYSNGQLRHYDWGREGNLARYGQEFPPAYKLQRLEDVLLEAGVKVDLSIGSADVLYNKFDFKKCTQCLGRAGTSNLLEDYNHLDYLWAKSAHMELYPHVLRHLSR